MAKRSQEEFYDSVDALKDFEGKNPFIADRNRIIRFIASVTWKRKGHSEYSESELTVHWDYGDFYGPSVVVDTQKSENHSELFHGSFSPWHQFYIYDNKNDILRIKEEHGLYEVVIVALRGWVD